MIAVHSLLTTAITYFPIDLRPCPILPHPIRQDHNERNKRALPECGAISVEGTVPDLKTWEKTGKDKKMSRWQPVELEELRRKSNW